MGKEEGKATQPGVEGSHPLPYTPNPVPPGEGGTRLQKVIAASGLASRRKAEQLIAQGRVTVNGHTIRELGTRVDPDHDHVKVDGRHLRGVEPHAYVLLNKPKGYVSSLSDPEGRPTIKDLLYGVHVRVFPVGRLDFDTEGVLLLTNHGAMAQALLHPRYHVPKVYLVKVKGVLSDEEIRHLEEGVDLEDGRTSPAIVRKIKKAQENSWVELTIHEGRTHQVKRMLGAVGHLVMKLKRVKFGPLTVGDLAPGEFRYLTDREANALRAVLKSRDSEMGKTGSDRARSGSITPFRSPRSSPSSLSDRDHRVSGGTRSFPGRPMPPASGGDRHGARAARPPLAGRDRYAAERSQPKDAGRIRRAAGGPRSFTPSRPRAGQDQLPSRGTRVFPGASPRTKSDRPGVPGRGAARRQSGRSRPLRGKSGPPGRGTSSRRPSGFQPRARRRKP